MRLIGDYNRRPKETRRSWQGCDLDLTGVVIDGSMDFSGAEFSGGMVEFGDATFSGGAVFFGSYGVLQQPGNLLPRRVRRQPGVFR